MDSYLPEAIRMMQEVIRIEPPRRVRALCYEDVEQGQETLQLKIMAPSTRCGSMGSIGEAVEETWV